MKGKAGSTARAKGHGAGPQKGALSRASLKLRIEFPEHRKIGPGKIELLERIGRTGSISAAAREMDMSYRRAWLLVDEIGKLFKRPLLTTAAGGAKGGGAELTEFGREVIEAFRRIEERTSEVIREELKAFEADLDNV
jgi:molybdate transport system regulatory protein